MNVDLDLHPDERAQYEAQLRRRVEQFARLCAEPAFPPTPILAMFVGNLLRASLPLCGKALVTELLEWLAGAVREQEGRCPFCGAPLPASGARMCATCEGQADAFERDLLLHSAKGPTQ
jgi:hypothetical protein